MPFLEPSLEKRLAYNYVTNKDAELTKEISRLLIGNPEPCNVNVRELDLVTRNVENTIVFESYIPGVVETAYDYCVMGISMVDPGDKLFGDFHSRARTFLRNLADICGNYEKKHFLVSALVHADVACNFFEDKDKIIYGKALSSRGEIKGSLQILQGMN